jgi:hypothetical protein
MNWYVLEKNTNFNLPEWSRTFGIDEGGLLYVPAAVTLIPEDEVLKRLDADPNANIPMAQYNDHFYMPGNWLSKEYPQIADICLLFEYQAQKINV